MACQSSENLKSEIIEEVMSELDEFTLRSGEYWQQHFDETAILTKKETQKAFINVFTRELKSKTHNEITETVESLNLSVNDGKKLLACLKTGEKDLSEDCLNRIGMIMTPFANSFFEYMGENAYYTAFDYVINGANLVEKTADSSDCLSLKIGEFFSKQDSVKIIRANKFQMEIKGTDTTKFNLMWSDKCTYKLSPINGKNDTIFTYEIIDKVKSGYRFIGRMYIDNNLTTSQIGIVE